MISASGTLESTVRLARRHPVDVIAGSVLLTAVAMVVVNALYLQPGPHPAPFFSVKGASRPEPQPITVLPRPRPAEANATKAPPAARARQDVVSDLQRELLRRGYYDGAVDGVYGPKTDAAIRDFEQGTGLKPSGEPTEDLLRTVLQATTKSSTPAAVQSAPRKDPLGDLIAPPSKRIMSVQRALSDFGYAQIKPTGTMGPETRAAIEKFERDRRLPVTGMITDRLVRELAGATGRPLE